MGHLACLQCQFNLIDSLALGQRRHRRDHPGLFSSSIQRFQHMRGPVRSPKKDALLARSDAHKLGHQLASRLSRGACKPALGPAARGERCLVARIEPVQSLHESRHRQVASRLPKKPFGGVGGFLVSRLSVPGVLSATEVTTAATTSSTASSAPTTPAATGRSRVCCPLASLARPQRWYAHACGRVGGRRLLGRAPRLKEPSLPLGQRTVGRAISMHASMRWYGRRATARATPCRKACATAHIAGHAACSTVGRAVGRPDGWRRWRRWRLRRRRRSGCTLPHVGRANTEAVRVRPVVQVEPLAVDCSDRCNQRPAARPGRLAGHAPPPCSPCQRAAGCIRYAAASSASTAATAATRPAGQRRGQQYCKPRDQRYGPWRRPCGRAWRGLWLFGRTTACSRAC
mmetsp:Transcript_39819/g.104572  ORF Transcript_39819/g.104572 Transcript_39819/m.104572 type:complete len:401 (-) Transcript_39819:936-2138(-)